MSQKPAHHRKQLLIDPHFQLNFIAYSCAIGLIISAILFAANRFFFWKLQERGLSLGLPADHVFFKFLLEQQRMMSWIYAGTALLSFGVIFVFGLYLSNRIAGPIYNVRKNLEARLGGGQDGGTFRKIQFRKKDYFHELADGLNAYFDKAEGNGK